MAPSLLSLVLFAAPPVRVAVAVLLPVAVVCSCLLVPWPVFGALLLTAFMVLLNTWLFGIGNLGDGALLVSRRSPLFPLAELGLWLTMLCLFSLLLVHYLGYVLRYTRLRPPSGALSVCMP